MYTLVTNRSITNGRYYGSRTYSVANKWIYHIGNSSEVEASDKGNEIIDLRGLTVMPGLIDIHTHGLMGYNIMTASPAEINEISKCKLQEGVTGFFPTTMAASKDETQKVVDNIQTAVLNGIDGASILGITLEGPWVNKEKPGALQAQHFQPINVDELASFVFNAQLAVPGGLVNVTIAPELPNAIEAIKSLSAFGVNCCLGHSVATYDQAKAGVEAGAKIATHAYNGMNQMHHRDPGLVGAVLTTEHLAAEIICDLVHVHPAAVDLAVKAKGSRNIILVTDSIAAAGLPDGTYNAGEMQLIKKDGVVRTPEGILAGSCVGLMECVRNMYEVVGIPLVEAVAMATETPARVVGTFQSVGSLERNKNANIIAIDDDFNVRFVMVSGEIKVPLR